MPNTLLVVDGRSHPRALTERLAALGYACLYARGPLRARSLLSQETVDLILWKDNTGNADLSAELLAEWQGHPEIPVVRLYGPGALTPAGVSPVKLAQAVYANLPVDLGELQLFTTLSRCLTERMPQVKVPPRTELAFRHAVTQLRTSPGQELAATDSLYADGDPHTALSERERELLRERQVADALAQVTRPKPWRKVWDRWVSGVLARTAS